MNEHVPLPPTLDPLPDAERMRATDAWAIGTGEVDGEGLMDAAGSALAEAVLGLAPEGPVIVVCGAGNNGGDGYVAVRRLRAQGLDARVVSTAPPERLEGDAAWARDALHAAEGDGVTSAWAPGALADAALVVDAVLGTGATGAPRGPAGEAIAEIGAASDAGVPVVACDVPSGVDATTGEVPGDAVRATRTVTFHAATPGLWIHPGKGHVGELVVADIGIPALPHETVVEAGEVPAVPDAPADAPPPEPAWIGLLNDRVLGPLPVRGDDSNKFSTGHVEVVGGQPGMAGAPCLTAHAAGRAGAGYVTLAVAETIAQTVAVRSPIESLLTALPVAGDGGVSADAARVLLEDLRKPGDTLVMGPGLGRSDDRDRFVRTLVSEAEGPMVLDADALFPFAGAPEDLRVRRAATVLTPHAGELARLLAVEADDLAARRLHHARDAAARSGAVVVLKGDDSIVAAPDGRVAVSPGDAAVLATAGSGDVLAGIVGALLARDVDPFDAACAGVWLHLRAGLHCVERHGVEGTVASDVATAVAAVRARFDAAEG